MPRFFRPDGTAFDVPDAWWEQAGMQQVPNDSVAYVDDGASEFTAAIRDIQPPRRSEGIVLDFDGFSRARMIAILQALRLSIPLPAIQLVQGQSATHRYVLKDGFHRYHAAIACGLSHVPALTGWVP